MEAAIKTVGLLVVAFCVSAGVVLIFDAAKALLGKPVTLVVAGIVIVGLAHSIVNQQR